MKLNLKWRETINPFGILLNDFKIVEVLGYPPAGNDVFYIKGLLNGNIYYAFLKVERQLGADIANEINIIKQLKYTYVPEILDCSIKDIKYIITREIEGKRLSTILEENKNININKYLYKLGRELAIFHQTNINAQDVKHRKFFDIPSQEYFAKHNLEKVSEYLHNNIPDNFNKCFIHGDFHYANILWKEEEIVGVLDYELSGYGIKEYDIAWAVFLRPTQQFLKTIAEQEIFLDGYSSISSFDRKAFDFFLINIACHFYALGNDNYRKEIEKIIDAKIL